MIFQGPGGREPRGAADHAARGLALTDGVGVECKHAVLGVWKE